MNNTYSFKLLQDIANTTYVKVLFTGLTGHMEDVLKWKEQNLPCGVGAQFVYTSQTEDGLCRFFRFIGTNAN